MNSREMILQSVRNALTDLKPRPSIPPSPTVWTVENRSSEELVPVFKQSLESVQGELLSVPHREQAVKEINRILGEIEARSIGLFDRPAVQEIAVSLKSDVVQQRPPQNPEDVDPKIMSTWDAAIVTSDYLLADTGSCVFSAPTAFDRVLCYIAPVCIILASPSMLRENMPHLWKDWQHRFGRADSLRNQENEAQMGGEFLIMTGPSRTADIEKVLILGVHGPKRVIVVLVNE